MISNSFFNPIESPSSVTSRFTPIPLNSSEKEKSIFLKARDLILSGRMNELETLTKEDPSIDLDKLYGALAFGFIKNPEILERIQTLITKQTQKEKGLTFRECVRPLPNCSYKEIAMIIQLAELLDPIASA